MSEEKPSADSDSTPAAPVTEPSGVAPEAISVPRQSSGPAIETDGTAPPQTVASTADEAPAQTVSEAVESAPAEPPAAEPPTGVVLAAAQPTPEPATVPADSTPAVDPAAAIPAVLAPAIPAVPAFEAPAAPRKKKGSRLAGLIFAVVVLVLLAAIGVLVYLKLFADPTRNAVAGNCLADLPVVAVGEDKEVTKARIVDCNDAAATHLVEARIDNTTEAEAKNPDVCKAHPDSTFIYRAVPPGGTGYVLCLKKLAE